MLYFVLCIIFVVLSLLLVLGFFFMLFVVVVDMLVNIFIQYIKMVNSYNIVEVL